MIKKAVGQADHYLPISSLLPLLLKRIRKPVKFIHVTRNPFDNISTMTRRSGRPLADSAEIYFKRAEAVQIAKSMTKSADWLDIQHEEMVAKPADTLQLICGFFNLGCTPEYLKACAALVFPSPNKTREKQHWDSSLIDSVAEQISQYQFLQSYSYEN